ncbi:winged helix-turn-helix transcriptional regulator [Streptomyces sp. NPDC058646]|uniref:winged helix-turn-helix transcriptional regulator n=1 Tax=Streptomyces sp. NPDC058646 TaxID=3346574 RepID=UPI0036520FA4
MSLPRDYSGQGCALARSLEVVGERWTLLIVRDAFFGVRRFGDFVAHLGIPRAVLSDRLATLTGASVLTRVPASGKREVYELTGKGLELWPVIRALTLWGEQFYAPEGGGPRRILRHAADGAALAADDRCTRCGVLVGVRDILLTPGPGLPGPDSADDPVTAALHHPHRLLSTLPPAKGNPS